MIKTNQIIVFGLFFTLVSISAKAQNDTIYFSDSNIIVGEVKDMTRGVLTVETDYSDSDFKIEWEKVKRFKSKEFFNVALVDRTVLEHVQLTTITDGKMALAGTDSGRVVNTADIVYLRSLDDSFWSRVSASIDLGYSITKADNLEQFNTRSSLGYKSNRWMLAATYNQVRSNQDDVAPIKRTDASVSANRQLKNSFFVGAKINFLSNTEQLIKLRTTGQLGGGYYFARTNNMYWNGFLGIAFNNENFLNDPETVEPNEDRKSYEGVIGTELNLYDIGDLNLLTNATWYPSITEAGRNRVDLQFDVSYDLPLDFYVKAGITLNYDSDPTAGASNSDYVFQTGFGWEL